MKARKKILSLFLFVVVFLMIIPQVGWGENLSGTTIIESHADDAEIWWFPLLSQSKEVLMSCYPSSAIHQHLVINGIRAVMPNYEFIPLQGILKQYDAKQIAHNKVLRESIVTDDFLRTRLEQFVRGANIIITHSPWGEYGHIQHRQIWRVVEALAIKYGKDVWVWNGMVSAHTLMVYATAYVGSVPQVTLQTDYDLYYQLRQVYIDAEGLFAQNPPLDSYWWDGRFWTWDRPWEGMPSYSPPPYIVFLKMIGGGKILYNSYYVENIIKKVLMEYQGYY